MAEEVGNLLVRAETVVEDQVADPSNTSVSESLPSICFQWALLVIVNHGVVEKRYSSCQGEGVGKVQTIMGILFPKRLCGLVPEWRRTLQVLRAAGSVEARQTMTPFLVDPPDRPLREGYPWFVGVPVTEESRDPFCFYLVCVLCDIRVPDPSELEWQLGRFQVVLSLQVNFQPMP